MMVRQEKQAFSGWTNLVILFLCYCFLYGVVFYGFSVVFPAMVKAMNWARGDASIAHTLRGIVVGFAAPLAAYLVNRKGVRPTLLWGGTLCIVGLVLLGTVMTELWQWTLLWGCVVGLGLSLAGLVPIQTNITFWFSRRRGMAMGIVSTGAAVGGFIAQPLFSWIMKYFGSWQIGWLCAAGFAFLGIIGVFWLRNKPSDVGQYPDGIDPTQATGATAAGGRAAARTHRTAETWSLGEAVRTRALWCLIVCYCMTAMPLYLITTHGIMHVTDHGYTSMEGAFFLSLVVLGGGIARFPVGWLADLIEARWLLATALAGILVSLLIIWRVPSFPVLLAAGCLFGFCYGSGLVLVPTAVGNYYGPSSFASINSFMFPFQVGFGAITPVAAGYIFDFTRSYDLAFIILSIMAAVAALSALIAAPPLKRSLA